jgi:predicted metal-dependent enzyme (double-stranded beta helix superfamily)
MNLNYSISSFVADVLEITNSTADERSIISRVSPLAIRAAADPDWRTEEMFLADEELGFGSTLLHAESDNSLFIVVDSWLPGRGVRPHDHGTWAVVVSVTGPEKNTFWQRIGEGSKAGIAELRKLEEKTINVGEVATMRAGEIHSVLNETAQTTLSFHVYGKHLNFTGRSQFEVENNKEIPFIIETR